MEALWFGAANRDPRGMRAPHLAFGSGPHRCLGAMFARDILRAVLGAWFERIPRHRVRGVRRTASYLHGYASLWIDVTQRDR